MTFYNYYSKYKNFDYESFWANITDEHILKILSRNKTDEYGFLALLSPSASKHLEIMAEKAHQLSLQHFGKAILLYTPMYLSNHCINRCLYCGFNSGNKITREKLAPEQIEKEAAAISNTGLRHILVLTGESKKETPLSYIINAVEILKKYFDSISLEIYPLTEEEYSRAADAGADGLTIYQEVYNEEIYQKIHLSGPKTDYHFRLDAPERACRAKMRNVNIGALLGLNDWRKEAFAAGLHGSYLQNKYTDVEVSISIPRIRPHKGSFNEIEFVKDKELVQIILALRLFLPYSGITLSTRENQHLRNNLIPLGITKMSAGVSTKVGGHSSNSEGENQFEINDTRSVQEIKNAILHRGYQPIFKNWMHI